MLIITGTGRCGTSVLAEFCRRCGYETGGSWSERRNAGREHLTVVSVNERLHSMLCKEEAVDLENCAAAVRSIKAAVIKDPRFLWHPQIIWYWRKWRPNLRVLLLCRHFEDVVSSGVQYLDPHYSRSADDHRNHFAEFVLMLVEHAIPFQCLAFPAFLRQFDRVYTALTGFGQLRIDRNEGRALWDDVIDLNKVHFNSHDIRRAGDG